MKLKIYYYNHELRFGHFKGFEVQEAIETESRYVIWCIINLVHFAIDPRLFLLMKVDSTPIFLQALEINLAKWELVSVWLSEQDEDGWSNEYLSYENWLKEEFGDDAETAYWNLD